MRNFLLLFFVPVKDIGFIVVMNKGEGAGDPAKLSVSGSRSMSETTVVGQLGDDPRLLRCKGQICALSNYGSGSLTIISLDAGGDPAIVGSYPVGSGPVGIDLTDDGQGHTAIISTSATDGSFSITKVNVAGELVSNETMTAPTDCVSPAHAAWLPAVGGPARAELSHGQRWLCYFGGITVE